MLVERIQQRQHGGDDAGLFGFEKQSHGARNRNAQTLRGFAGFAVINNKSQTFFVGEGDGFGFAGVHNEFQGGDHAFVRRCFFDEPRRALTKLGDDRRRGDRLQQGGKQRQLSDSLQTYKARAVENGREFHHAVSAASSDAG